MCYDRQHKNQFCGNETFLGKSLKLLSATHVNLLVRRKVALCPYLDRRFHYLTRESNPVSTLLLGGDLEQKIADLTKVSDVAKKLTFTPRSTNRSRPFRHRRGMFRGESLTSKYSISGQIFRLWLLQKGSHKRT